MPLTLGLCFNLWIGQSFCNTEYDRELIRIFSSKMSLVDVYQDILKISVFFYLISFQSNRILKNSWLKKNMILGPNSLFSAICHFFLHFTSIFSHLSANVCLIRLGYATRSTFPLKMLHTGWETFIFWLHYVHEIMQNLMRWLLK